MESDNSFSMCITNEFFQFQFSLLTKEYGRNKKVSFRFKITRKASYLRICSDYGLRNIQIFSRIFPIYLACDGDDSPLSDTHFTFLVPLLLFGIFMHKFFRT